MSRQPSVKTSFTETWGYAMRCILQAASHLLHARIRGLGLAQPQWLALVRLTILENPTAAQLARHMGQDAATMMRVLEKLEARGLITRTRSQTDRRVLHLALSAEGRRLTRLIDEQMAISAEINDALLGAEVGMGFVPWRRSALWAKARVGAVSSGIGGRDRFAGPDRFRFARARRSGAIGTVGLRSDGRPCRRFPGERQVGVDEPDGAECTGEGDCDAFTNTSPLRIST